MSALSALFRLTAVLAMVGAISATARAGDSSTHRWYGTGPAWYEAPCGLKGFAEAHADGSPERLVPCARQTPERGANSDSDQAVGGRTGHHESGDYDREGRRQPVPPRPRDQR